MDILTGKVIRHYEAGSETGTLKSNFIYSIYQTRAGDILVGTSEGLFRYNPGADNFTALPESSELYPYTTVVLEDEEGTIWGGTFKEGVYYFNPQTEEKGYFKYDPEDINSISNNGVNSIFQDSNKNLWFATENGLNKFISKEKMFERYTTSNGLPSNVIYEILEDHQNYLWISTSKGLVKFNPHNESIKIFTKAHGLLSDQLNYSSAYKTAEGKMYFGSVKGMVGFSPAEFIINDYIPPVYITGFQVQHQELPVGKENSPLRNSITHTDKIILTHNQSSFSLDFAALSYTAPEMTEYVYTLEGLDNEWTTLKTNRKIYFTELAPGAYTFKVKATNSSGVWNDKAAQLNIEILPPFWLNKLAYFLYFSFGACSLFFFIRNYHRQTEKRNKRKIDLLENEKEKEIYQAKIQFFTNVAHEIRTPLTLIKGPLERVIRNTEELPEVQYNLKTMEKNTQRLLDLTNQLLDFRKTEIKGFSLTFVKADVSNLINETFQRFIPAADQNDIEFTLDLPESQVSAYVDPEALTKILSNLFSNAIKYADNKVSVRLLPFQFNSDKTFTILVKNDGMIIPPGMKDKIFEPFFRLAESETKTGTGIGLPLARSMAELHKGTLELDIMEKSVNIFALTLPVHQEKEFNLFNEETDENSSLANVAEEEVLSKPTILLVDDQKELVNFLANDLGKEYIVLKAYDGEKAFEIIKRETIHLVVSDVMMPKMGGFELCKEIKTTLDYSHIPIILLTAKNSLQAKIQGLESGADAYIEKPFSPEHLHVQISNLLTNRIKIKDFFSSSPLAHLKSMAYTKADEGFLEKLDKAIYAHITDTDLNVEHLAEIMNMSKPTLYRKIKALSNLTPNELINIARLKKAAALLKEGDYKMYEVANIVGYNSQTSFGRNFLKQFGMTPSEYAHKDHSKKAEL
jgi:signal transduction histidine kinase/CheY-like chemotaxis protein